MRNHHDSGPFSFHYTGVIDPAKVLAPCPVSVLPSSVIENSTVASRDSEGTSYAEGKSTLFLVSKQEIPVIVVEGGFPGDFYACWDTTKAVACVLQTNRSRAFEFSVIAGKPPDLPQPPTATP